MKIKANCKMKTKNYMALMIAGIYVGFIYILISVMLFVQPEYNSFLEAFNKFIGVIFLILGIASIMIGTYGLLTLD
ncbi:MAG: hypothetical protein ACP5TW_05855, partial [Thermoplasmata archaeon]